MQQQPNFPPKPSPLDPSTSQPYLYPPAFSKEEYYGGARAFQPSPYPPPTMLNIMSIPPNPAASYVDSQKIKKKERNNSNSSERGDKSKNSSAMKNLQTLPGGYPIKKPPVIRDGDWECPECKNINFAKRTECNRCKASKPLPDRKDRKPATHLGGPPGLFKEGDWVCPKCRNVNFQRRNKCNRCGEMKPDDNEVRTGKAGGHYDRQDPKDRKNFKESDDEYDDFGRKKKKKRQSRSRERSRSNGKNRDDSREKKNRKKSRSREREKSRSRQRNRTRSKSKEKKQRSHS